MPVFAPLIILSWPNGTFKRLRKTEVNLTRTMVWCQATMIALNVSSAYAVEKLLYPDRIRLTDGKINRPQKWDTYESGCSIPDLTRGITSSVFEAETKAPGTTRWFLSPFWCALDGQSLNYRDLELYLRANPVIASAICKYHEFDGHQIPQIDVDNKTSLLELEGIDLVESIVLLLEIGRQSMSQHLIGNVLSQYVTRTTDIAGIPELRGIFHRVLDHIEDRYLAWLYVSYDNDFIPPWRVREPDLYEPFAQKILEDARRENPEYGL
jgi:hypothetical protein